MKRVRVLCDTAGGFIDCMLELPDRATIDDALAAAYARLGRPELAAADAATGVDGRLQPRSCVPADGERVEIYRPLRADPRTQRRARARAGSGPGRRRD